MIIVEFFAGPGSGKTTMSTGAFSAFKSEGIECEFTREYAQELIYKGREHILRDQNQFSISAGQYTKYKELERCGVELLFSDTSMSLCRLYAPATPKNEALFTVIDYAEKEFDIIKVFVSRVKPYQTKGRLQTAEQARCLDDLVQKQCGPFDITIPGSKHAMPILVDKLKELIESRKKGAGDASNP